MVEKNYLAAAVAHGHKRKLQGIDPKKYALSIWKLFIAADIAETAAMEMGLYNASRLYRDYRE